MAKLIRRIAYFARRRKLEAELAEEMEFHLAMTGRSAMGNTTLAAEDARAVWIWPWIESFLRDLAYGWRTMLRQPGFTLVALLALGSAIGINTSLFTVFNGLALKPWPVRDPARVVTIGEHYSIAQYRYLAENTHALSGAIAMRRCGDVKYQGRPIGCSAVSGNYFGVLGVEMQLGRGFRQNEDRADATQAVAVISHALWRNRLGEDPDVVGKNIRLDDIPFTVVGVASREFLGTPTGDIWIPLPALLTLRPNDPSMRQMLTSPRFCCSQIAGRLAPGVTREQASAEMELLLNQFGRQFAIDNAKVEVRDTRWLSAASMRDKTGYAIVALGLLFVAVTLVLLLACANVGNLLLARAAARRQEIAVRLSLGGSRMRLIRQLLVESLALALSAAAAGFAIAWVLPGIVVSRLEPSSVGRLRPDASVLAYTMLIAVAACIAFGLAPALHATRGNLADALRQESRLPGLRLSLRNVLLSVQVAVSVVLLTGAGLLVRGIQRTEAMDPGFVIKGISVVSLDLPASDYAGPRTKAFAQQLQAQLEGAGSGLAFCELAPLANSHRQISFRLPGEDAQTGHSTEFNEVGPGYFELLGIPLLSGRMFIQADSGGKVAIVNEAMARCYWPGENPVGKTIFVGVPRQIVGLVKDASTQGLGPAEPLLYEPFSGRVVPHILVRGGGPSERVSTVAKQLEPRVEVRVAPLTESLDRAIEPSVIGAEVAGGLGVLALVLASIGLSGVFAYMVRQRTREIGIRMALGARPWDAVRLVLASNLRGLVGGLLLGLVGAAGASKVLAHQFSSVTALDSLAYAGVILLLGAAAITATAAPARRAARVDPSIALRWE
ncbi:MAG: ADOP family duplicated permease [Acidobacteriia bacterium]|nr:ADOP family duplicated permease [Terriglobia bacterium]